MIKNPVTNEFSLLPGLKFDLAASDLASQPRIWLHSIDFGLFLFCERPIFVVRNIVIRNVVAKLREAKSCPMIGLNGLRNVAKLLEAKSCPMIPIGFPSIQPRIRPRQCLFSL